jgi:uncharacterized membrane protein YsdA (DUF1294 family)
MTNANIAKGVVGKSMKQIAVIYLIIINLIAFALYGTDKSKAKRGKWRISEKTLIGIALIGGSVGAFLGMHAFRHKTRHWYFRYGLPAIFLAQVVLLAFIRNRL